jgi:hypothetical protein
MYNAIADVPWMYKPRHAHINESTATYPGFDDDGHNGPPSTAFRNRKTYPINKKNRINSKSADIPLKTKNILLNDVVRKKEELVGKRSK